VDRVTARVFAGAVDRMLATAQAGSR